MFTGIIEEVGKVADIRNTFTVSSIRISAEKVLEGTEVGDSIATNGVCLTVAELGEGFFVADTMPETLKRSSLGKLRIGSPVNLERALKLDSRLGGHIVTGHIDGTGNVLSVTKDTNAYVIRIGASRDILRYVVEKGSIAIDGISLTVAAVTASDFTVSIIPHTFESTDLSDKTVGSEVNLECDIIGKYVEKMVSSEASSEEPVSLSFLAENGFV